MQPTPKILILGCGPCAQRLASNLLHRNMSVILAANPADSPPAFKPQELDRDHPLLELLKDCRLLECSGYAGAFQVVLGNNGRPIECTVAGIVVAEEEKRRPNFALYGLKPGHKVLSISEMERKTESQLFYSKAVSPAQVVFLNGLKQDAHPAITARMLNACRRLQQTAAVNTCFITGNLKVGAEGLEVLYRDLKAAGTLFIKYTDQVPQIETSADDRIGITYWDDVMRLPATLHADMLVVDEKIGPSDYLGYLAQRLKLATDHIGFLQSDNVHRYANHTNRTGIFVAGAARAVQALPEQLEDADSAALSVVRYLVQSTESALPPAEIDPGACVRCLTCYRLCPYQAVKLGETMNVHSGSCHGCGLCAAECPAVAIRIQGLNQEQMARRLAESDPHLEQTARFTPALVAFGCLRSAGRAHQLAVAMGHRLPYRLTVVEVPCGGGISIHHILSAFSGGQDGVIVLTCHGDNCHSETGNTHARRRTEQVARLLTGMGIAPERLVFHTLAANMGGEFARLVNQLEAKIQTMGPFEGSDRTTVRPKAREG